MENNNKWVETYIRMFCNHEQNNWATLLHTAEFAYNNHHHPSIGMSPFRANAGYDMSLMGTGPSRGHDTPLRLALLCRLHERCKLWLDKAQKQQGRQYNQRHRDAPALAPGSEVWLSSRDISMDRPLPKLDALRYGPFRVLEATGPLTYRVELPPHWQIHNVFHRSKLHPIHEDRVPERVNPVGPQVTAKDRRPPDEEYIEPQPPRQRKARR